MNKLINAKMKFLRDFQEKFPTSHVGGSIGLLIHGVYLGRDLTLSDLDITVDEFQESDMTKEKLESRSDNNDFDFCLLKHVEDGLYIKIDLRINPEPSFEVVEYQGFKYNVSKERDILFWKSKYAAKGVAKHENDLYFIKNGVALVNTCDELDDDLPF